MPALVVNMFDWTEIGMFLGIILGLSVLGGTYLAVSIFVDWICGNDS